MIRSSIARAVSSPVTRPVNGAKFSFETVIKKLFANSEQGFAYDPNDLTTMFRDVVGTVPVTGAGQAVGLLLDKSKGSVIGEEKITNGNFANGSTGWFGINNTDETVSNGFLNFTNAVAGNPNASQINIISPSKWYKVSFRVANRVAGAVFLMAYAVDSGNVTQTAQVTSDGVYTAILRAPPDADGRLGVRVTANSTLSVTDISVKELHGNHAYQTTSSMRPLLVASPQRLDYDTADDNLITTLPAQLTGCTVVRAVPNVGTQILTGQTIPTTYNDNTDHCGLIVINRALTATETSQITKLFNKAAGV